MIARERVRTALSGREPDRVPIDLGGSSVTTLTAGACRRLCEHLGLDLRDEVLMSKSFQTVRVPEAIQVEFQADLRCLYPGKSHNSRETVDPDGTWTDEWGIKYALGANGNYYDIIEHPLAEATADDLSDYPWPDPFDAGRTEGLKEQALTLAEKTPYAIVGNLSRGFIFELAWNLRGFETFLMDLVMNKEFAHSLLQRITDIQKKRAEAFLSVVGEYLDLCRISDDLAGQRNTLISLDTYREMIKPYHFDYFKTIKSLTKAKLALHCCGNIRPFIKDLMEIGMDVLNPVQYVCDAMNPKSLKEEFGDQLCFWGGIDTQQILPFGDEEAVREEVKARISDMASGGRYILAPAHNIQPDVPPQNITAMYSTALSLGRYR